MYKGGANHTDFYAIPAGGTFTGGESPLVTLNKTVSSKPTGIMKNGTSLEWEQLLNTPGLAKMLSDYAIAGSDSDNEEVTLEDGVKEGGSGQEPTLFCVAYFGTYNDGGGTRRQIMYGPVELSDSTGDFETASGNYAKRNIGVKFVKAITALTLHADIFSATLIEKTDATGDLPLTLTVATGLYGHEAWVLTP